MRPWHIFPILAPALWAGVTFGGLWPADWPEWLAEPWMPIACMALGLVLSILTSFAMADGRNPSKRVPTSCTSPSSSCAARSPPWGACACPPCRTCVSRCPTP